jgi:hypothetical protein
MGSGKTTLAEMLKSQKGFIHYDADIWILGFDAEKDAGKIVTPDLYGSIAERCPRRSKLHREYLLNYCQPLFSEWEPGPQLRRKPPKWRQQQKDQVKGGEAEYKKALKAEKFSMAVIACDKWISEVGLTVVDLEKAREAGFSQRVFYQAMQNLSPGTWPHPDTAVDSDTEVPTKAQMDLWQREREHLNEVIDRYFKEMCEDISVVCEREDNADKFIVVSHVVYERRSREQIRTLMKARGRRVEFVVIEGEDLSNLIVTRKAKQILRETTDVEAADDDRKIKEAAESQWFPSGMKQEQREQRLRFTPVDYHEKAEAPDLRFELTKDMSKDKCLAKLLELLGPLTDFED